MIWTVPFSCFLPRLKWERRGFLARWILSVPFCKCLIPNKMGNTCCCSVGWGPILCAQIIVHLFIRCQNPSHLFIVEHSFVNVQGIAMYASSVWEAGAIHHLHSGCAFARSLGSRTNGTQEKTQC